MKENWDTREVGLHLSSDYDTYKAINSMHQHGTPLQDLDDMLSEWELPESCHVDRSRVNWQQVLDYIIY